VTVMNTGSGTLRVTGVAVTGDFQFANACTTPLGAGASCTIQLAFAPTLLGPLSGSLTVTTDPGGPFDVSLSGTGTAPRARLRWTGPKPKGWAGIVGLSFADDYARQ
jgi:hypothetical protein